MNSLQKKNDPLKAIFDYHKKELSDQKFTHDIMEKLPEKNMFFRYFILSISLLTALLIILFSGSLISFSNYIIDLCLHRPRIDLSNFLSINTIRFYIFSLSLIGTLGFSAYFCIKKS